MLKKSVINELLLKQKINGKILKNFKNYGII